MMNVANIGDVIAVLDDMCAVGILRKWAVGGAFAATLHDEPIATLDLDIFFLFSKEQKSLILDLSDIYEYANSHGFTFDHEFVDIHGWLVQFVESSKNDLWLESLERTTNIAIGDRAVAVIAPDYLAAMWLLAGRKKDFAKIAAFFDSGLVDRSNLMDIIDRHGLRLQWEKERRRFDEE
jgi:hypothetical protein